MAAAHGKRAPASGERLAKPVMEISTPVGPLHPKVLALWPSKAGSHEWTPGRIDGDTSALYLSFGGSGPFCVPGRSKHTPGWHAEWHAECLAHRLKLQECTLNLDDLGFFSGSCSRYIRAADVCLQSHLHLLISFFFAHHSHSLLQLATNPPGSASYPNNNHHHAFQRPLHPSPRLRPRQRRPRQRDPRHQPQPRQA